MNYKKNVALKKIRKGDIVHIGESIIRLIRSNNEHSTIEVISDLNISYERINMEPEGEGKYHSSSPSYIGHVKYYRKDDEKK